MVRMGMGMGMDMGMDMDMDMGMGIILRQDQRSCIYNFQELVN